MLDLLSKYSLAEIVVFIVMLGIAIKELITFMDWASDRLKRVFKKETNQEKAFTEVKQQITNLSEQLDIAVKGFQEYLSIDEEKINTMQQTIDILIESDKDDIKSWITSQHHYFCYEKGFIDDYSLDCIERRFKHYKDEGGNSFIETLMNELRALPKVSVIDGYTQYHNTQDKEN